MLLVAAKCLSRPSCAGLYSANSVEDEARPCVTIPLADESWMNRLEAVLERVLTSVRSGPTPEKGEHTSKGGAEP